MVTGRWDRRVGDPWSIGFGHRGTWLTLAAALVCLWAVPAAWGASEPKYGGVLNATLSEAPPSLSIHEEATVAAVWPMMPCYNNLILFDPLKKQESVNTIIGELAEKWAWQDGGKSLVFHLRKGVKWHDGQPFSSKDVKHTFDVVREAPEAPAKLRVNPRKLWYENVVYIETPDPDTVIFRLKRPQPSLLLMLASGYSPVYPAHVPPAELRTKCVGTGPFKLKEYRPGEYVDLVKHPDYMIRGRPYLDGIRYLIIRERGTRYSAIQAGRQDIAYPLEVAKTIAESVKQAVPRMVLVEMSTNVNDHILVNFRRPLFRDPRVRRAISLAIDRKAYIQAGRQGAAVPGGVMLPRPYGVWGLPEKEQAKMHFDLAIDHYKKSWEHSLHAMRIAEGMEKSHLLEARQPEGAFHSLTLNSIQGPHLHQNIPNTGGSRKSPFAG